MKKRFFVVCFLTACIALSSCSLNPLARSTYRPGHHATKHGKKAQQEASRASRHFWF